MLRVLILLLVLTGAASADGLGINHQRKTVTFPSGSAPATNGEMGFDGTNFLFRENGVNLVFSSGASAPALKSDAVGLRAIFVSASVVNIAADRFVVSNGTSNTVLSNVSVSPNVSTAGPAANGRDQAGAFTTESWIYGHVIYNGSTTAGLWSASDTSPTLPSGYTYAGLGTIARYVGGNTVRDFVQIGRTVRYYQGFHTILSGGTATTWTAVSASSFIPPRARIGHFNAAWLNTSSVGQILYVGGDNNQIEAEIVGPTIGSYVYQQFSCNTNSSQQIYYYVSLGTGANAYLYVHGYEWY